MSLLDSAPVRTAVVLFSIYQVIGRHVEVNPPYAVVNLGDPIVMLCQTSGDLQYCRINIPGDFKGHLVEPNQPLPKHLKYEGGGLDKGHCGFRIEHAEDRHNGVFVCNLRVNGEYTEISENMTLIVARSPTPAEMLVATMGTSSEKTIYNEGDMFIANCQVRNGRPMTNFTWYLGDDVLTEGLSPPRFVLSAKAEDLYSTEQNFSRQLQASDNGKEIKCIADHPGLDEKGKQGHRLITVNFPPKASREKFEKFGLLEGSEGRIDIKVNANPRPSFTWNIGGTELVEGEGTERFSVLKSSKLGPGTWESVLIINKLTKEDVDQKYIVKAKNELGENDYPVEISTSPEPKAVSIGIETIVIIIIIILIVFIIIGGVLYARAKGRWCFAVPVISPKITGESSDTESADHTTSEVKQKKSFISVFKKNNDKVTTIPEESVKVQIDTKPTDEFNQDGETKPEGNANVDNSEGVVYAELDIQARHNEGPAVVRGDDDKTEYAEIIHTKSK